MIPLPWEAGPLTGWRLDAREHASTWDSGVGARRVGGRWNPIGVETVYSCTDPATAILEVAVHKGFPTLDARPHVLTRFEVTDPRHVHVIHPDDVPNSLWLFPCDPSDAQQHFGREALETHRFVLVPSAVSRNSWNLLFDPARAKDHYRLIEQVPFALDPRLNPPRR